LTFGPRGVSGATKKKGRDLLAFLEVKFIDMICSAACQGFGVLGLRHILDSETSGSRV